MFARCCAVRVHETKTARIPTSLHLVGLSRNRRAPHYDMRNKEGEGKHVGGTVYLLAVISVLSDFFY